LDDEERARCERHLEARATVQAELESHRSRSAVGIGHPEDDVAGDVAGRDGHERRVEEVG
jgi:hypothetical protein